MICCLNGRNSILFWYLSEKMIRKIAVERKKLVFLFLQLNTRCADGREVREFAIKIFFRLSSVLCSDCTVKFPLDCPKDSPGSSPNVKPLKTPQNFPASFAVFPYLNFAILFEKSESEFFVAALTAKQILTQKDMMEEKEMIYEY